MVRKVKAELQWISNYCPIKFEYGARVSNEFMFASEEEQLDILKRI